MLEYNSSSGEDDDQRKNQHEILTLKTKLAQLEASLKPLYYKYDHHLEKDHSKHPNVQVSMDFDAPQISINSDYLSPEVNKHMYCPMVADDDKINFYDGYSTIQVKEPFRRANFGPLSWTSLMQRDFWISLLRKSVDCKYTDPSVYPSLYTSAVPNIPVLMKHLQKNKESDFQKTALQREGIYELAPLQTLLSNKNYKLGENGTLPAGSLTLGKTLFEGKFDNDLHLVEKIKLILPKKRVFWLLIDKYFGNLYAFIPFLDETSFKGDLAKIFGPVDLSDEPFSQVKVEKKLDLATVAIALIVLRMTCLSLFSNRSCVNDLFIQNDWKGENFKNAKEMKYLMINSINVSVIEVAQLCIESFQLSRKTNLTIFQSVLYMRLYHAFAPEDGDNLDGGDSQVSTALLIQMAYSLGLNREPLLFPDIFTDPKINNLTRKIWHFLVRSDLFHSFSIGNPPSIDFRHFDIRPPYLEAGNENSRSQAVEAAVADSFYYFYIRINYFRRLLDIVLDINKFTPVNKLTAVLNNLEKTFRDEFHPLVALNDDNYEVFNQDCITPDNFHAILSVRYVMSTGCSMVSVFFHFYLHYEKNGNYELTFFYLKKMFHIIMEFILPYCDLIVNGKLSKDGFFLNPSLMMAIHKINQVCISALTRILYIRYSFESNKDHQHLLRTDNQYYKINHWYKKLGDKLHKLGVVCTKIFSRFSSRYYFAWRIYKAHGYLFHAIHDKTSYENMQKNPESTNAKMFQFTLTQIEDLCGTVDNAIKTIENINNFEDSCSEADFLDMAASGKGKGMQRKMGNRNGKITPFSFSLKPLIKPVNKTTPEKKLKKTSMKSEFFENELDTLQQAASVASTVTNNSTDGGSTPDSFYHNHDVDQMWLLMLAMRNNLPNETNFGNFDNMEPQPGNMQFSPINQQQFYSPNPEPVPNINTTGMNQNNSANMHKPPAHPSVNPLLNNMNGQFNDTNEVKPNDLNPGLNSTPDPRLGNVFNNSNVQGENLFPNNPGLTPNTNPSLNPNFSELLFLGDFDFFTNSTGLDQLL